MSKTIKTLEQLRVAAAQEESQYGKRKEYALRLNETLPLAWYDIDKHAPVADKVAVETERSAYVELLTQKGHSNPRQAWLKIRGYAREALAPKVEATAEGEGEATAEGEAPNPAKDRAAKWLETLAKVAKQVEEAEAVTFPALKALEHIRSAIAVMSGGIKG